MVLSMLCGQYHEIVHCLLIGRVGLWPVGILFFMSALFTFAAGSRITTPCVWHESPAVLDVPRKGHQAKATSSQQCRRPAVGAICTRSVQSATDCRRMMQSAPTERHNNQQSSVVHSTACRVSRDQTDSYIVRSLDYPEMFDRGMLISSSVFGGCPDALE